MYIIIVTSLSGAGKTEALHKLEDAGFGCIYNLPVSLINGVVQNMADSGVESLALGIDGGSLPADEMAAEIERMKQDGHTVLNLYLTARDDVLLRRYSETRRNHPMKRDDFIDAGILRERAIMQPYEQLADQVLDTSDWKPAELHQRLETLIGTRCQEFVLMLRSFGYKYGVPLDSDWVIDVRFLPNPYWVDALRPLTGCDQAVRDFIATYPEAGQFVDGLVALLLPLLSRYRQMGKPGLTVSLGCTGGQHRSVYIAERVAQELAGQGTVLQLQHRELLRRQQ